MTALITSIQQFIGKHHSRNLVRNLYQFQAFNPVEGVSNTLHILTYQMFYHESGLLPKDYRIGLDTHLQNPTPPTRSNYIHLAYAPIAQYSVH